MHLAFKVLLTALIASVINWIGKSVVLELVSVVERPRTSLCAHF